MSQEPLRITEIDLCNITYPKYKITKNKKIILIKYQTKHDFVFQTPTLLNTKKARIFNNYSEIEVALVGKEENKVNNFISFLNNLENKIKSDAQYNAHSWFDTNKIKNINFQNIIRKSNNYPNGILKLKLINSNNFTTNLQSDNRHITNNEIRENSWCKILLECYAVWINANNDFGLFFRPVNILFIEKKVYNYNFYQDSDDSSECIPDTEANIFMSIPSKNNEIDNYIDTEKNSISEIIRKINLVSSSESDDQLNINVETKNEIDLKTSDSSDRTTNSSSVTSSES